MLKIQELREIIRLIDQSTISEFTYENDGTSITLKKNDSSALSVEALEALTESQAQTSAVIVDKDDRPAANKAQVQRDDEASKSVDVQEDETDLHTIESPMVGTFYAAPSPEQPAFVKVGQKVTEETVVCIVEAMKLFNEIEAEVKGEIVEVLVENGQLVEYGQPLFFVKPE